MIYFKPGDPCSSSLVIHLLATEKNAYLQILKGAVPKVIGNTYQYYVKKSIWTFDCLLQM